MTNDENEIAAGEGETPKKQMTLAEWLAGGEAKGTDRAHACKKCGCRRNRVISTQQDKKNEITFRIRRCEYCGNEFYTTERYGVGGDAE